MSKTYYADSSALAKRHISETGSPWIEQEFDTASGNKIITSKLSVAEVLSAMNRRRREANITAAEYAKFFGDFLAFVAADYEMIELSDAVLLESQRLLETYPLPVGKHSVFGVQVHDAKIAASMRAHNIKNILIFNGKISNA